MVGNPEYRRYSTQGHGKVSAVWLGATIHCNDHSEHSGKAISRQQAALFLFLSPSPSVAGPEYLVIDTRVAPQTKISPILFETRMQRSIRCPPPAPPSRSRTSPRDLKKSYTMLDNDLDNHSKFSTHYSQYRPGACNQETESFENPRPP